MYVGIVPKGAIRVNPMAPIERGREWARTEDLHYCLNKTNSSMLLLSNETLPCKYFDAAINVFPRGSDSTVSITTRITNESQYVSNTDMNTPDTSWVTTESNTFYLADIEDYTVCQSFCFFAYCFVLSCIT